MKNVIAYLSLAAMIVFALTGMPLLTLAGFVVLTVAVIASFMEAEPESKVVFSKNAQSKSQIS
ncbi:hypothetical protein [Massilibacterium senegalense]|uniref:hypothetical protein n=1 Tax=Massilibacterium senegalense TaxID=1632858 RepID=UPI000782794B|nr:hypothetical protein [Massilibacterium senegalense]